MDRTLTNRQIVFLVFGSIVGYGILNFPRDLAEVAGSGGWFSLLVSTVAAIIITYIIVNLGYIYENQTLDEYSKIIAGKFFTYIFLLVYILDFFLFFIFVTRIVSEVIKLSILFKTPIWALMLLFLVVVYYLITRGIKGIARLCELYGIIIIVSAFILFSLIFTQGQLLNLKPIFVLADIKKYMKAVTIVIPFLGMEILTFIPINKKKNKKLFKYLIYILISIGFLYIFEYEACLSIIGVEDIVYYKNALIAVIRRVNLPFLQFLERIDGLVISIWIMATFCTISLLGYGTAFYLNRIFKKVNFDLISLIIIIIAFIVGQIPDKFEDLEIILQYSGYLGLVSAIIIPSILLILAKVKKYD